MNDKEYYKKLKELVDKSKINEEWDYQGWWDKPIEELLTQNDWNQTLLRKINEVSAALRKTLEPEGCAIFDDIETYYPTTDNSFFTENVELYAELSIKYIEMYIFHIILLW